MRLLLLRWRLHWLRCRRLHRVVLALVLALLLVLLLALLLALLLVWLLLMLLMMRHGRPVRRVVPRWWRRHAPH